LLIRRSPQHKTTDSITIIHHFHNLRISNSATNPQTTIPNNRNERSFPNDTSKSTPTKRILIISDNKRTNQMKSLYSKDVGFSHSRKENSMYSPRINEEYIPKLYWLAKSKKTRMTKLVNEIISLHLEQQNEKDLTPSK
jgi:plasmid maintenance system killer protein